MYLKPRQKRALDTEKKFLDSFDSLMAVSPFTLTTIEDIAHHHANLTRAAFMKRFGSKEQALVRLFVQYSDKGAEAVYQQLPQLREIPELPKALTEMSKLIESLHIQSPAAGRAMLEQSLLGPEMQNLIQKDIEFWAATICSIHHEADSSRTPTRRSARIAAHYLLSNNSKYLLGMHHWLPRRHEARHALMGNMAFRYVKQIALLRERNKAPRTDTK